MIPLRSKTVQHHGFCARHEQYSPRRYPPPSAMPHRNCVATARLNGTRIPLGQVGSTRAKDLILVLPHKRPQKRRAPQSGALHPGFLAPHRLGRQLSKVPTGFGFRHGGSVSPASRLARTPPKLRQMPLREALDSRLGEAWASGLEVVQPSAPGIGAGHVKRA